MWLPLVLLLRMLLLPMLLPMWRLLPPVLLPMLLPMWRLLPPVLLPMWLLLLPMRLRPLHPVCGEHGLGWLLDHRLWEHALEDLTRGIRTEV